MARSYRKVPIIGIGGGSEKWCKKQWHRRARHAEKDLIATLLKTEKLEEIVYRSHPSEPIFYDDSHTEMVSMLETHVTTHTYEVSDTWGMHKDGKCHCGYDEIRRVKDNPRHHERVILHKQDRYVRQVWLK